MKFVKMGEHDYSEFHAMANAYYREGEDENTPQEIIDSFIRMMFNKVTNNEIYGCLAEHEQKYVGFALWAIDSEDFEFSEMPGLDTILEIGVIPSYRSLGFGKSLLAHIENSFQKKSVEQCYVSAYGPAQKFWERCGYAKNGANASNGLTIMIKTIV